MAVGIKVGAGVDLLGDGAFVTAFFSTVAGNLEADGWATRFPTVMGPLYDGALAAELVPLARAELAEIRAQLSRLPVERIIWDLGDPSARPPWGDEIAPDITDLGNYFVTMDGNDVFAVLDEALAYAQSSGQGAGLRSIGPLGGPGLPPG
jgi:2,3-bisphosphoglycerate-dependent phosphoglycerate mutase